MNKLDEAKFIIGRFDHYFDSINNKGNLYLVLNTFFIGSIITGYYSLDKQYHFHNLFLYLFLFMLLLSIGSIVLTLLAIKPFFRKRKEIKDKSLYYYGDIAKSDIADYKKDFLEASEKDLINDASKQIHNLACGLKGKFQKISIASIFIGMQILFVLFFAILIINKY